MVHFCLLFDLFSIPLLDNFNSFTKTSLDSGFVFDYLDDFIVH